MENQILLAKDVSYPFPKEMQATHYTIRYITITASPLFYK